jgi:hypothetical protein
MKEAIMADEPNRQDVQRRAYELYEQRGREEGHDWDDWLQAEHELRGTEVQATAPQSDESTPRRRRVERAEELAQT